MMPVLSIVPWKSSMIGHMLTILANRSSVTSELMTPSATQAPNTVRRLFRSEDKPSPPSFMETSDCADNTVSVIDVLVVARLTQAETETEMFANSSPVFDKKLKGGNGRKYTNSIDLVQVLQNRKNKIYDYVTGRFQTPGRKVETKRVEKIEGTDEHKSSDGIASPARVVSTPASSSVTTPYASMYSRFTSAVAKSPRVQYIPPSLHTPGSNHTPSPVVKQKRMGNA
eukprot:gene45071-60175_t